MIDLALLTKLRETYKDLDKALTDAEDHITKDGLPLCDFQMFRTE